MAKANVLARRIRTYERRVEELLAPRTRGSFEAHDAARAEAKRLGGLLTKTQEEFAAFLATRTKGPWAAFARASA
jgi:hypothetical protein